MWCTFAGFSRAGDVEGGRGVEWSNGGEVDALLEKGRQCGASDSSWRGFLLSFIFFSSFLNLCFAHPHGYKFFRVSYARENGPRRPRKNIYTERA